ncbi:MAG TPA: hypothetical protein VFN74_16500 [Chloroflexota bacterium]|nr:hypothetical protein [Chloroflexota bacterium]
MRAWDVGAVVHARRPERGTVNQTLLLTTERGRFVLRGYRHTELEPVAREHAVIAHVCARGNRRVAQFIQGSGPWVPVSERWASVRDACTEQGQ